MATERVYLVITSDRRYRVAKRPQIRADEVAVAVTLTFPDSWGQVIAAVDVNVPDWAPTVEEGGTGAR